TGLLQYSFSLLSCLHNKNFITEPEYGNTFGHQLTQHDDLVFLESYSFNKTVQLQFNSTVGKFVAFTEKDMQHAKAWNEDPNIMQLMKVNMELLFMMVNRYVLKILLSNSVKPKVKLSLVKWDQDNHSTILMCSAYDFYPEQIKVSWLRDGKPMTSDMTSTLEMADGDWYYQIHTHLEYTPKSGETISCMVEHASLIKPLIYDWDPSLPEPERNKIAIGAAGLVLGIIITTAGLFYYKKKSALMGMRAIPIDHSVLM
uniref:H-2 class II histocompatibility antigen, E-D beta chain-like n=1 Tax=Sinocyclocheilus rhinocerous TaxID=307959 RepID=A0A673I4S9_9TELE